MAEPIDPTEAFFLGKAAFENGDLSIALSHLAAETKVNPRNIAAHLLIGSSFVKAGHYLQAFQVWSALILHPEVRSNEPLPKDEVDTLMVATLLGWGVSIEAAGFLENDLALFRKAVDFYGGEAFRGRHTVELVGLDEGLHRKLAVSETFAGIIAKKSA